MEKIFKAMAHNRSDSVGPNTEAVKVNERESGSKCKEGIQDSKESTMSGNRNDFGKVGTKPAEKRSQSDLVCATAEVLRRKEAVYGGTGYTSHQQKHFEVAARVLRKFNSKQECFDLEALLLQAEREIISGIGLRSEISVSRFIDASSVCAIPPAYTHEWANNMVEQDRLVAAVLIYRVVLEACKGMLLATDLFDWHVRVVENIYDLTQIMSEAEDAYERRFSQDYAIAFMEKVYKAAKLIECTPTELWRLRKANGIAKCAGYIADICNKVNMFRVALQYVEEGIESTDETGSKETAMLGLLLQLKGEVHLRVGDYSNGVRCLVDAVVALQNATNFKSRKHKKQAISRVHETLKEDYE